MKRVVLLAFVVCGSFCHLNSQNIFDPNDPVVRYDAAAAYGTAQKPDTNRTGLQKWVSSSTSGISTGSGSFDASSYKAYFINFYNVRLSFRLKFPRSFTNPDSVQKKYPVMLFLHGAGEVACASNGGIYNNEKQLLHGGKLFRDRVDNNQFDGFLLYPQLRSKDAGCWGEWGRAPNANYNTIIAIIDSLVKHVRLDNDRVFVSGLSGGGVGAWEIAEDYPARIAKIAPTSAAGLGMNYPSFVHIPIWLATGGKDGNPSPAQASTTQNNILQIGGNMRRSLYADLGHSSWYRHWEEPDFVPYMNDMHKANPLIFFNRFEFCPDSAVSVKLGITAGFNAYEWEKDGVLIATRTGTTNTIVNAASVISFTGNEITVRSLGTYRVRFRRINNGPWSEWSPRPAVISPKPLTQTPPIEVTGLSSKVLPSPDGKTSVPLQLPAGFLNYQWVRTTDNAVVSNVHTYQAPVGTYKARYTEPFGCGALYSPLFKVVSTAGTPKPDAASNLSVAPVSQTTLQLDWSDNPNPTNNETGFEVYRAAKAGGPYTLVRITAEDVITCQDTALQANTTYFYIVRAVNESGAAAASNEGSAKTEVDNQAPLAPSDLEYRGSTSTTISLRWKAATDNVSVARYDVYSSGVKIYSTPATFFTVPNLDSAASYTFTVKAVDKSGNTSPASNQVIAYTHRPGLNYKYYNGTYNTLPDFNTLTPFKTGVTDTVNAGAGIRTQADNYAFLWEAKIYIPVAGMYTFETGSDDGSKLYIDTTYAFGTPALVSNDGVHGVQLRTGKKYLTQGYHSIVITYAEVGGGEEMSIYWSSTAGLSRERIPRNFFTTGDYVSATGIETPSSLVATPVSYNKINLAWTDNSSNETGFEIVRSTSIEGVYSPVATTTANQTAYSDSGLTAGTFYYYKIRAVSSGAVSPFTSAFIEGNWNLNSNYLDSNNGGASRALSGNNASFNSNDEKEGSHAISIANNGYLSFNAGNSGFPSQGGYSQRTVALWFKPTLTTNKRMVFDFGGNDNGLALGMMNGTLYAGVASGSSRHNASLASFISNENWFAGQWNHVAVVYDVNVLRLYLNGVQVAVNNALPFVSVGNSTNASRIANNNSSNAFNDNSGFSTLQGLFDNIYVIRGALSTQEVGLLKNSLTTRQSAAATLPAPAPPPTPADFTVKPLSVNSIELSFNDVSSSETGFEVWRSSGNKANNRKIALLPPDEEAARIFIDSTLFANVTYYYQLRSIGIGGISAFTEEKAATTFNTNPLITKVDNFTMKYGTTFTLPIAAKDADGEPVTLTTGTLPAFVALQQTGPGQATLTFTPGLAETGSYNISIYSADTHDGADTASFVLVVNDNDVPVMGNIQQSAMISEEGTLQLPLSATDNGGGAALAWTFEGLPSFGNFTDNLNGTGTLSFKPGYLSSGEYLVRIIVTDQGDAWTSRSLLLTVTDKDPEETFQLDFRSQSPLMPLWNSINVTPPTISHGVITSTQNNPSTLALTIVKGTVLATTLGPQTFSNTGVFPDLVMKDNMVWGFDTGNNLYDTLVLKASGLNTAKRYSFIFHAGYNIAGDANSITIFRIGNEVAQVRYYRNTLMTDTIADVQPSATGEVLITIIGDPFFNKGGMINAMVIKSSFDDGSLPAKPSGLAGSHLPSSGVKLTWTDRAYNETGYAVYRAPVRNGEYTLLNSGAKNKDSVSYLDSTATPHTDFYYYVAGVHPGGIGTPSDTIKVAVGNYQPVITAPAQNYLKTDSLQHIAFTVADDPADAVSVSLEAAPSFLTLEHRSGNNYRIVAAPAADHIGWITATIKATDNLGAAASKTINIAVSDKTTRSVYVDYGTFGRTAPAPWNNWPGSKGANAAIANLRDENNVITPFGVTMLTGWSGVTDLGHVTGDNSGAVPDSVLLSGIIDNGTTKSIRINGLNNAMKYNIVIVGSQNEGTSASTEYASGLVKDTLDARYNTRQTANLNGLVPSAGQITFTATRLAGSVVSFLNGLIIEEYDPAVTLLHPLNLYAEAVDRNSIHLSWSDRTTEEDINEGYHLERATDSLFSQNAVTIALAGNTTVYKDSSLTPGTRYWYRVRARSAAGGLSAYSNRAKATTAASIIYVDFNFTLPTADNPWNSFSASPTFEGSLNNLNNQSGTNTGINLALTKVFNGEFTAGVNTGNNSGIVPDKVLASNFWLDNQQVSEFKVSGLNHSKRYRIGFFGSSSSVGWFKGNYTATYTVNGRTAYLNSWMNSSKVVYLDQLVPDENGELVLSFSTTRAAIYGFNSGIIIQDYTGAGNGADTLANGGAVVMNAVSGASTAEEALALSQNGQTQGTGRIYPNPVTDFINVDFNNSSANNNLAIDIYDLSGRLIYRKNLGRLGAGNNTVRLHAADAGMVTGVYFITLNVNGKPVQAGKVVKTRNK